MITLPRTDRRQAGIVTDYRKWQCTAGWDFRASFADADFFATLNRTSGIRAGFGGFGWTTGSASNATISNPAGGDFLASGDDAPIAVVVDFDGLAAQRVGGPKIFGSYAHALQASYFLGYFPTQLIMEGMFRCSVNPAADNTGSFFGITSPSATATNGTGSIGVIKSGASGFALQSSGSSANGSAIDTNWHHWRIVVDATNVTAYKDGVQDAQISTVTDSFPCTFMIYAGNDTARFECSWFRMYYN